jgi:DNA polymerase-3 subunit gamma/tau
VTPCGECESCRTIAAGTSLDVIEMDAASNRSVDDIRDLRERVGYAPAAGRWKVYILDEAHMLTREAWNAFLKTLEEPPPNTVFVLCTTEPHKVMPTIVDRCQRFDYQRPSLEQIAEVVRRVAAAESIAIEDGAVAAIARAATGSFRDALGTLDQLVAYGGKEVVTDDVLTVLGVAEAELILAAADAIAAEDGRAALEASERLAQSGRDLGQFGRDLLAHLRQLLVIRTMGEVPATFSVTAADSERLRVQADAFSDLALSRAIDTIAAALAAIKEGDEPRMTLELAVLRAARPDVDPSRAALAQRLERLERRIEGADVEDAAAQPEDNPGPAAVATQTVDLERIRGLWPAVLDQVRESGSELLSTVLGAARPVAVDLERAVLEVGFPAGAAFNKRKAEAQEARERLADAVKTIVGERLRPVYVLLEGDDEGAAGGAEPVLSEEELIDRLKSEFDAEEFEAADAKEAEG